MFGKLFVLSDFLRTVQPKLSALFVLAAVFGGFFTQPLTAQELPDEIRGYKVHKAKIVVTNQTGEKNKKDESEAFVRMDDPVMVEKGLSGVTFEISGEIDSLEHSGKVDFLTFRDFTVNGMKVEIPEYNESFEFKKNELLRFPKPLRVNVGTLQTLRGALDEFRNSKEEWEVRGTVFVFGKFKKWGFNFKRVVPVEVNVKIKNPIKKESILPEVIPQFD